MGDELLKNQIFNAGLISKQAFYDIDQEHKQKHLNRLPIYNGNDRDENFLIKANEIVVSRKDDDSDTVNVISSLNGAGIKNLKSDNELQLEALMNNLVIEGVSMYDYNPEKEGIDQGLSVQIAGLVTLDSTNKILPGQFVEISLPSTNPKSHDTLQKITGLPIDKKVLELKPVNPASFASRLLLHTNRILIDKRKYQQSMNIKLRSTNRWLALVHDIFNSYQFSM